MELDTRLPTKDGSWRDVRISTAPIHNAEGWTCGMMAVLTDVTERRQMERQLHFQALHDSLTGLPNRKLLYERLDQSLLETSRRRSTLALLVMDLDGFKDVNDTFGHHYGDLLLQDVTLRIQDALDQALVARLGGDEFAAVVPDIDGGAAAGLAEKILAALSETFSLAGQKLTVGASVGVSVYPMDGTDANTLLQHADAAMYIAKRRRSGYALYSSLRERTRSIEVVPTPGRS